jgi:prepilin-type N-terminal cleavage/methylation domain-containing protein
MKHFRAFTLIELLVVISIISLLSSIAIASLGTARTKANDTAIAAFGQELTRKIADCAVNGGKIQIPNNQTSPTNLMCSLGAAYGTWPKAPSSWYYHQHVYVNGEENLLYMYKSGGPASTYNGMYCGHYPDYSSLCPVSPKACNVSNSYGCTRQTSSGSYE